MIEGTFDISIDTMKYHRRGTVALKSNAGIIAAELNAADLEPMYFEGTCEDKDFTIEGSGEFGLHGHVDFTAQGSVWGNSIDIKCETNVGPITMFGTRISTSAGEFKSSHEYMMAASKAEFSAADGTMYSGLYADGG